METYFKLKMIEEYIIPIILIVLGLLAMLLFFVVANVEYNLKRKMLKAMKYEKREEQFDHTLDIKSYYFTKVNKNGKMIRISENRVGNMSPKELKKYLNKMEESE